MAVSELSAPVTKSYVATAHADNEHADCPAVAAFDITEEKARQIVQLSMVVREHGLLDCRKWDYSTLWLRSDPDEADEGEDDEEGEDDDEDEMRTECDCLVVTEDKFRFMCYLKHGDSRIDCEGQPIEGLAAFFNIPWTHPRKV